jgi:SRSO17 transposase
MIPPSQERRPLRRCRAAIRYGLSATFRQGLSGRGLTWAVGIPKHQKVYPHDVELIFPVSVHGRPRKHPMPDTLSAAAETILAGSIWKKVSWRRGTKGRLAARFAAACIRIVDGSPQRILDKGQQHMPGGEAWLVGEWRSNGERKYHLSNLPADATLKVLAAASKARWVCEQARQQMKEELGLYHFEGRSWQGLHRRALLTIIAYAFLPHQRLQTAKRGTTRRHVRKGPPEPTLPAIRRAAISALAIPITGIRCPHCERQIRSEESVLPR